MEEQPYDEQQHDIEEDNEQDSIMDEDSIWWEWESFYSWASSGFFEYSYSIHPIGFIELPSESAMDAAGRDPEQPFKDFRAARHAHQRTRKYSKRKDSRRKRRGLDKKRPGYGIALKDAYLGIKSREWEDDWEAEQAHNTDLEHMDDILAYYRFGKNADIFEQSDGREVVHGEDFGSWARRRIHEMRTIKESRIRNHGSDTCPKPLPNIKQHTVHNTWRPGRINATIPTAPYSNPTQTTLPTTPTDIDAHATLVCVLRPSKFYLAHCRRRNLPPYQHIEGFSWFGEYTWKWHRNASGCWTLGYGDGCEYDGAFPCECSCNGSLTYRCYCDEFKVGTWWEGPAPEEQQACSLIEWVKGELRERMEDDERSFQAQLRKGEEEEDELMRRAEESGTSWEANSGGDEFECEWDHSWEDEYVVCESEGSEDWSVVSGVEQRRFATLKDGGGIDGESNSRLECRSEDEVLW
ncbi:hypothetical protein PTMSG1_06053 [Pyrenophora teres f. maculata]|nr:hypothetical protein PTMSG1_06053 [Pyrenophora teres f. maculata]